MKKHYAVFREGVEGRREIIIQREPASDGVTSEDEQIEFLAVPANGGDESNYSKQIKLHVGKSLLHDREIRLPAPMSARGPKQVELMSQSS